MGGEAACGAGYTRAVLSSAAQAQGVTLLPLAQALKDKPQLLERYLFGGGAAPASALSALHQAFLGEGTFIHVPAGVKVASPILLRSLQGPAQPAFFPHTLVVLEAGAELTIIEELASVDERPGFTMGVSELVVGEAARLSYIHHQGLNRLSTVALRQQTRLGRDSYLYTLGLANGAAHSGSLLESMLKEEGATVDLLGLVLAGQGQQMELRTLQDHAARGGNSDALVKSILRGDARFWFDGVVRIHKAGQNSNAFQSNPNLLLSSECRAESIPTLEIEADDVACKHAASIGSLDEEQRFYLLSRGISPKDAEAAIVEGFAAELAQRLPAGPLQEAFTDILSRLACQAA